MVEETLVAYMGCPFSHHLKLDLEDIKEHSCTGIVLWVPEYDLLFFPEAKIAPATRIAHELGLKVYADLWGFGNAFCHNARISQFVQENTDTWQRGSDNIKTPTACLNNAHFREWMQAQISSFVERFEVDGFVWDELHFDERGWPRVWHCRCQACEEVFAERNDYKMPTELTVDVVKFRQESAADFIQFLCSEVKKLSAKLVNSIVLYPEVEAPSRFGTEDWRTIASIEGLDALGSDPYWIGLEDRIGASESPYQIRGEASLEKRIRDFGDRLVKLAKSNGKKATLWVQAVSIPEGHEDEVHDAAIVAASTGVDVLAAWSYMDYSFTPSGNPRLVWERLTSAFGEVLGRE